MWVLLETNEQIYLEPGGQDFLPKATLGKENDVQWLIQEIPGDIDWPGMSYTVAAIQNYGQACVAVVTSIESKDPKASAIKLCQQTLRENKSELLDQHQKTWEKFWSRSGVKLEEKIFEKMWYRQLYFLRCITKPGVQSPALYFSLTTDTPMWHGDYHVNYNLQSTFWSTLSCNHPELMEPYNRLMDQYLPRAEWLGKQVYDVEGAYFPHLIYAYETNPLKSKSKNRRQFIHHVWGMTLGLGAFSIQPMWQQYKYWPDQERLRNEIWPAMRATSLFYLNFMEKCEKDRQGKVRLGPTTSPEIHAWTKNFKLNYNCTFDISQISYLFHAVIEASTILNTDHELAQRCKAMLEVMPDYPIDPAKQVVVDVENSPVGTWQNIPGPYTPVFPGDMVHWWSDPKQKELFIRTMPTVVAPQHTNSYVMEPVARSRLGMTDAYDLALKLLGNRRSPNGMLGLTAWNDVDRSKRYANAFGMYSEMAAASFAINELMIQSVGDIIRLFPSWKKSKSASFENLRTQGGFLVSASFQNGKVQPFTVQSTVGGNLQILSPWQKIQVEFNGVKQKLQLDEKGIVILQTKKGMSMFFSNAEGK